MLQVNARFQVDYPLVLPDVKRTSEQQLLIDQRTLDRVFHCHQKIGAISASKSMKIQV